MDVIACIAEELGVVPRQVEAAVALLDEGATVPFIARYRKEATGSLDDTQLRQLESRLEYLRELDERRETILSSIREQGKLTADLEQAILAADSKTLLEDLYLPYKPKRRTKAQIAREAGLEPLADLFFSDPSLDPVSGAAAYADPEKGVTDAAAALEGGRQILMERFAEDAKLSGGLREKIWKAGILVTRVVKGKEIEGAKFRDYFDFEEPIAKIPSHRALALFRGRSEDVLKLSLNTGNDEESAHAACKASIAHTFNIADRGRPADRWLAETVHATWKHKLLPRIDVDLKLRLRDAAEAEAIRVFARNLTDLLFAAPAGPKPTMGIDPGIRTGCKIAVVDATGKVLETATIYPHPPKNQWDQSIAQLVHLIREHGVQLVSIGNGTASRETEQLVGDLMKGHGELGVTKITVSEAGASVYSASEIAAREFPDLDVSLRGAVSIARRLQDPLAELVKIDPKSIGVGQYQHDVNQSHLAHSLDTVVEDCVNAVGVDVNTASVALLRYVSGLSRTIGQNIVQFRDRNGPFRNRDALKKVSRLGDKTFEQAAGFLRIQNGDNPLDASAVHPEAYPVVEKILLRTGKNISDLIGNAAFARSVNAADFVDERFGLPTVTDILKELKKPGRDPRPEFRSVRFREGVEKISDLEPGMKLEGVVTNVANFGAFVDVGVHQDGLVHISHLADRFVKDPGEIVKTGDMVKVTVLEVDTERRRISLSMKKNPMPSANDAETARQPQDPRGPRPGRSEDRAQRPRGAMADALAKALKRS